MAQQLNEPGCLLLFRYELHWVTEQKFESEVKLALDMVDLCVVGSEHMHKPPRLCKLAGVCLVMCGAGRRWGGGAAQVVREALKPGVPRPPWSAPRQWPAVSS